MDEILKALQQRETLGRVRPASSFLKALDPCVTPECLTSVHELGTYHQWQEAVQKSGDTLTYFDEGGNVILGGQKKDGQEFGGGLQIVESEVKAAGGIETAGAIMEFDAVITTSRRDRDRDVLETEGAELDPKSPLLFYHVPLMTLGKLVRQLKHTKTKLTGKLAIADTPLGHDAAGLVEFGALRISHGFRPSKFEPIKAKVGEEEGPQGFRVIKFKIFEVSLVSVPSNEDAIVLSYSRGKLHHPMMKALAKAKWDALAPVVRSGFEELVKKDGGACEACQEKDKKAKCPDCGAAMTPVCKECGYGEDDKNTNPAGVKECRLTKGRVSKLKNAAALINESLGHKEMKEARAVKALLKEAKTDVEAIIKDAETEEEPGPLDPSERSYEATVVDFLAGLYAGKDVDWLTLQTLQKEIGKRIANFEEKEIEKLLAG